jgi:hypothetical protein
MLDPDRKLGIAVTSKSKAAFGDMGSKAIKKREGAKPPGNRDFITDRA